MNCNKLVISDTVLTGGEFSITEFTSEGKSLEVNKSWRILYVIIVNRRSRTYNLWAHNPALYQASNTHFGIVIYFDYKTVLYNVLSANIVNKLKFIFES